MPSWAGITPGGRLWRVNDYLRLAGHHINKHRPLRRMRVA